MILLIPVPLTSRGAGPNLPPLFWGLGRGETFSGGEQLLMTGSLPCCLRRAERAVCPFLVPALPRPHTYPGLGIRCFVGFQVQPGNMARARSTGHFSLMFSSLPSFFLFSCSLFLPSFLAFTQMLIKHLLCGKLCSRCWG